MNAEESVTLHPAIVTSTKLPNQPPSAFLLSLFTFTYYLPDNSSPLRDTIGKKLHQALYRLIWSLRVTKANTLYESLSYRQRDYSPRNLYFIPRLHFLQSDHYGSDDTWSECCWCSHVNTCQVCWQGLFLHFTFSFLKGISVFYWNNNVNNETFFFHFRGSADLQDLHCF